MAANQMLSVLFTGLFSFAMQAATLDETQMQDYLASARVVWNADESLNILVRSEPLNPCTLRDTPHIAEMQWQDVQTTLTMEDGTEVVSHQLTYVIRINSNCDWSKLSLMQTMIHEVGHVVIGAEWHSSDPKSIMYYVVSGKQSITDADRAMIRTNREISSSK